MSINKILQETRDKLKALNDKYTAEEKKKDEQKNADKKAGK